MATRLEISETCDIISDNREFSWILSPQAFHLTVAHLMTYSMFLSVAIENVHCHFTRKKHTGDVIYVTTNIFKLVARDDLSDHQMSQWKVYVAAIYRDVRNI